jgi:hypothetical protein
MHCSAWPWHRSILADLSRACFGSGASAVYAYLILSLWSCHNPTNNPKQLKTTFVGVVLLSVKNPPPPPHHTTPDVITIRAVLGNLGSWLLVCSLILTQLDEEWKMTSIFLKMEDDLNISLKEDNLNNATN